MFKNPFSFDGRIRRTEYGLSYLIYMVAAVPFNFLSDGGGVTTTIMLVVLIPLMWFLLAQGAKRCHDRGNSGWYQLIPFYGLWMLFGDGDHGPNEYGADPKRPELDNELIDEIGTEGNDEGRGENILDKDSDW